MTDGVCKLSYFRLSKLAIRKGKKVILSPRGEIFESAIDHKGRLFGFLKRCFLWVVKCAYHNQVVFHGTSEEEVAAIKNYFGNTAKVALLPNYMILPVKVNAEVVTDQKNYLLYVGRINHMKNIDIIISGLAKSSLFMSSNVTLKIAGETGGEYYEGLVRQIDELGLKDKVEFLGLVTGKEKDVLYANAKCLLLMSKSENFGNVIVEALAQGTPAIASKGTPWERLNETGAGCWIDADANAVGSAIDKILCLEETDYSKMRLKAYQLSREFDIYSNVGKWEKVINDFSK